MKTCSLLLGLLLALPAVAQAQESDVAADTEPVVVEITFSVFPLDSANWEGIHFAPEGSPDAGVTEVAFNRRERSISYAYKGPMPLVFFRIGTDAEGNTVYRPVGAVNPGPEPAQQKLILFFEPKEADGPYTISVMQDSDTSFPEHSIVFFNTMPISFVGMLSEHRMLLPPGRSKPFDVSKFLEKEVPIALAIRQNDDLHLVARNRIRFAPERRTLMILRPPRREGSLRIRTQRLTEYTGALAEEALPKDEPKDKPAEN